MDRQKMFNMVVYVRNRSACAKRAVIKRQRCACSSDRSSPFVWTRPIVGRGSERRP